MRRDFANPPAHYRGEASLEMIQIKEANGRLDFKLPKFFLLITILRAETVLVHSKSNLTKSLQVILWLYC